MIEASPKTMKLSGLSKRCMSSHKYVEQHEGARARWERQLGFGHPRPELCSTVLFGFCTRALRATLQDPLAILAGLVFDVKVAASKVCNGELQVECFGVLEALRRYTLSRCRGRCGGNAPDPAIIFPRGFNEWLMRHWIVFV